MKKIDNLNPDLNPSLQNPGNNIAGEYVDMVTKINVNQPGSDVNQATLKHLEYLNALNLLSNGTNTVSAPSDTTGDSLLMNQVAYINALSSIAQSNPALLGTIEKLKMDTLSNPYSSESMANQINFLNTLNKPTAPIPAPVSPVSPVASADNLLERFDAIMNNPIIKDVTPVSEPIAHVIPVTPVATVAAPIIPVSPVVEPVIAPVQPSMTVAPETVIEPIVISTPQAPIETVVAPVSSTVLDSTYARKPEPIAPIIPVTPVIPVPSAPVSPIPVASSVPNLTETIIPTPIEPTPIIPVAPVIPVTPVAPVIPVAPVAPVIPVTPVAPVIPVTPVAPVIPVATAVETSPFQIPPVVMATPVVDTLSKDVLDSTFAPKTHPIEPVAPIVNSPILTPVVPSTPVAEIPAIIPVTPVVESIIPPAAPIIPAVGQIPAVPVAAVKPKKEKKKKEPKPKKPDGEKSYTGVFILILLILTLITAGYIGWQYDLIPVEIKENVTEFFAFSSTEDEELLEEEFAEPEISPEPEVAPEPEPEPSGSMAVSEIYSKVNPSVVGIAVESIGVGSSVGTGIVMSYDGYIITNNHVIEGGDLLTVSMFDGKIYDAEIVGTDSKTDLAVIKITPEDASPLVVADFGDSDALLVGDIAIAIGNPGGLELQGTLTGGYISAINRDILVDDRVMTLIQTDASINPGNSGGPLINHLGEVIGITTLKISSDNFEGLGFAVPSNEALPIAQELIENGFISGRPSIGISGINITKELAFYNDLPQGLLIKSVEPTSDAYAKGLKAGDIIVGINDVPTVDIAEINAIKNQFVAGDSIILDIYRSGQTLSISIVLMDESDTTAN